MPAALDPRLQLVVDQASARLREASPSVEDARRGWALTTAVADLPAEDVAAMADLELPGRSGPIRARSYRGTTCDGSAPLLVWYHGGGWVLGDLETADRVCRRIANRAGVAVLSVDYRLAPEHPAPAAVEDAWDALRWAAANAPALDADAEHVAVGGDSAGGNLAALMALRARDAGGPPLAHQLLIYPATDLSRESESHQAMASGLFDPAMVASWYSLYLGAADPTSAAVSPARAVDLTGLPPACIVTAGHDPLRDEGIDYAARLCRAGVAVAHIHEPAMLHGFIQLGAITPRAARVTDAFCEHLRRDVAA